MENQALFLGSSGHGDATEAAYSAPDEPLGRQSWYEYQIGIQQLVF